MNIKKTIVNDYVIVTEQSNSNKDIVSKAEVEKDAIGFIFCGSGETLVNTNHSKNSFNIYTGIAASFYSNPDVNITCNISHKKPLNVVSLYLSPEKINNLIESEELRYNKHFESLLNPQNEFVEGSFFLMNLNMQLAIDKIFSNKYTGITKKLMLESQVIELLSHYFGLIGNSVEISNLKKCDIDKLHYAKELLLNQIDAPPSLMELAHLTGLNSYKLKTGFKEIFGSPVYKFLQNQRMDKAYELFADKNLSVQEVAWSVGYESLSSFSNAFFKKFGFRPSMAKR